MEEINAINYRRQTKTQINDGIFSDNEIKYIQKGQKLQEVLAKCLHRICGVSIKEGNDFSDIKLIEEKLDGSLQHANQKDIFQRK